MTNQVTIEIETESGVWTDITSDVRQAVGVTVTRGRSDEQAQAGPQRMGFTLDNRDGRYSPRNPLSNLYGKIGRNTPVRCKIDSGSYTRFYGDIPGIAPKWNENHADNFIPIDAYGDLRRLGQGQPAVSNALRDWVLAQSALQAYYPLSGGEETVYSQNIAPGKSGSFSGYNSPVFTYGKDMGASWLGSGMELNDTTSTRWMQGTGSASGSHAAFDFVFQSPALGVLDVQLWPTYDSWFQVRLNTSADAGTAQVSYYDGNGTLITETATGVIPELQDTQLHTCRLQLSTSAGPVITYTVYIDGAQIDTGDNGLTQSLSGAPLFRFFYDRFAGQTVMNMAHLAVWADNTLANIPTASDYAEAAFAYAGETAIDRIARVCADGDIPLSTVGAAAESMPMGPQFTETRLDQIHDVEATDMGILVEKRNAPGLEYISRAAMYNQTPQFTLTYPGHISPPLDPVDDDQVTRNDVTATKREGGSVRYTVDTGPLSTLDPPDGVGRYETEVTVNVETDDLLDPVAGWIAGIGTLDKARWSSVTVNLNSPNLTEGLKDAIKDADVGDLFVITGMDAAFVYDDIRLIIVGYTESITPHVHTITFNCMPAEPYEVFIVESDRVSPGDLFQLNASLTTTATSMSVLSTDSVTLCTTSAGDMPVSIMVGGEEITVGAISGTTPGSAQTFSSLTRSVNGVVKTHASGETVRLKRRAGTAL